MSRNMRDDFKTEAYVLRRTNYGEADRILNIITPTGKLSVIAKGVRKEKSKLAGGVEMFSLVELNIHQGKSEMGLVTSARMLRYHKNIVANLDKMELAGGFLKKINRLVDGVECEDSFRVLKESLLGLDDGIDARVVEAWFIVNILKISGDEINLYRDVDGKKLVAGLRYNYDIMEKAFSPREDGDFGEEEIKLLRFMSTTELKLVTRIKNIQQWIDKVLNLLRIMIK